MKASELRIGNYLKRDVIVKIDARSIFDIWEETKEYQPIPLTEEWLLRMGFDQVEKYFTIKTGWYFGAGNEQKQTKLNIKHTSTGRFFVVSPANGSIYLSSVHQLQNLYFALTSQELEVKES